MWDFWPILKERTDYISGDAFSNSLVIPFGKTGGVHQGADTKNEWLSGMVRGHTALHVGCVDHLPVLQEKMAKGTWLHAQLVSSSGKCVGLDLSEEGIEVLRSRGVKNVFACDVTDADANKSLRDEFWDYILVPDVIEHLPRPADFGQLPNWQFDRHRL